VGYVNLNTVFSRGSIFGGGIINGTVHNVSGNINVDDGGGSPALLTINGNFTQGANGTTTVAIGGPLPGIDSDRLTVNGTATLAGTLAVTLIGGFIPDPSNPLDIYVPMIFNSETGGFSDDTYPVSTGLSYSIDVSQYGVTLTPILL
jgi:hypothetical protein